MGKMYIYTSVSLPLLQKSAKIIEVYKPVFLIALYIFVLIRQINTKLRRKSIFFVFIVLVVTSGSLLNLKTQSRTAKFVFRLH